ncbi:hypothetical protein TMEN_4650 [Trichophyton mentagrophytes]|uniref:Uncharacterized protein n=1 Tax=Trichophyton interdigitale (strain MR816) TaxID=1215338 RepID=A0A059JG31_TRIIM|nr:hypothetical protein H101_04417 [Trichophyton interdigitale H6]KDB26815.1 hypothetical protein H109_01383 [Trichophyton interdigitale MR816]GBF62117.1 hypothetical protein TMEN_4650 [Trichophyton mentagrophytes]
MNGNPVQSPEASVTPAPSKRKRETTAEGDADGTASTPGSGESAFPDTLKDLLLVLSKHDSDLGILSRPLAHVPTGEPENKRVKRSKTAVDQQSVQSRVEKSYYNSLEPFLHDVEQSINSFVAESQRHDSKTRRSTTQASPNESSSRANAFRKELNRLVLKISPQASPSATSIKPAKVESTPEPLAGNSRNDRLALALVDNTPHGRQIFSSVQKSDLPINETALPKGIVVTKIVPFNPLHMDESRTRTRTIGEVFAPRPNLPVLERPQKRPAESGPTVVEWLDPLEAASSLPSKLLGRKGYSQIPLPSGSWLNYGYENPLLSDNARRVPRQEAIEKEKFSKEDKSLFHAIYSSFAPSFDSSGAVAPRAAKYQAWWEKSGARRMNVLFNFEQNEEDFLASPKAHPTLDQVLDPQLLDEETLSEAVESFKPDTTYVDRATDSKEAESDKDKEKKAQSDIGEILDDISDLLQTLNSYRQLRNLSQQSPDKRTTDQSNGALPSQDPTATPSDAEYSIYETLKSSLSALVSSLPPYAVSKLTGEQLAELNLSKKILLDGADYPGILDDDDFTKQQKQAAQIQQNLVNSRAHTHGQVPQGRPAAYQTPTAPAPYQRQHATRQKHMPVNYQQVPPQGYAGRPPPPPPGHYQPVNPQPYAQHPPTGQRQGYMQPPYQQPAAASPPYSRSAMLQQFQRPASNGVPPYPQRRASPAQTPTQPYPHRTPQVAYHQPIHQPQLNHAATAQRMPQSPHGYNPPPQRTPYLNSPTGHPAQPRYFQQQTPQPMPYANYPPGQANQIHSPYAKASPGIPYPRSAAEQAAIMDRNKMQLLDGRAQAVASPQPMQPNGQPNGVPMATPGPSK